MNKKILVAASNNNGKIKEIKEIFTDYDILSISEMEKKLGKKIIVIENQMTFSENAREKVNCLYQEEMTIFVLEMILVYLLMH